MLIHSVYFWLTDEARASGTAEFEQALRDLVTLDLIRDAYIGTPAKTAPRPVTDNSFDYALILHFADQAAHDAYQDHPHHDAFVTQNKDRWARVQVRDTESAETAETE
jgi:hypothetical protein